MKRILIFLDNLWIHHTATSLEVALDNVRQEDLLVLTCGLESSLCDLNPGQSSAKCYACRGVTKVIDRKILPNSLWFTLPQHELPLDYSLDFDYESLGVRLNEVVFGTLAVEYKTDDYLYAVQNHSFTLKALARRCYNVLRWLQEITTEYDIKDIVAFNGRLSYSRTAVLWAQKNSVDFILHERTSSKNRYVKRFNQAVHSIEAGNNSIEEVWLNSDLALPEKEDVAKSYFEHRLNGNIPGWGSFTRKHVQGLVPLAPAGIETISVFTSSEFETIVIGTEWQLRVFSSQNEAVCWIASKTKDKNIRLFIRFHPNLANSKVDLSSTYNTLEKYDHVIVVKPDNPMSSYEILLNSDRIITFGSSIGFEAAYIGKQVVTLRDSIGRLPVKMNLIENKIELDDFLCGIYIPNKISKDDLYKWAFYLSKEGSDFSIYRPLNLYKGYFNQVRIEHSLLAKIYLKLNEIYTNSL